MKSFFRTVNARSLNANTMFLRSRAMTTTMVCLCLTMIGILIFSGQADAQTGGSKDAQPVTPQDIRVNSPEYRATPAYQTAMTAYNEMRYKEAIRGLLPFAQEGDSLAQTNLGIMYVNGSGVAKDDVEAVAWYRKASEQGNELAQSRLKDLGL